MPMIGFLNSRSPGEAAGELLGSGRVWLTPDISINMFTPRAAGHWLLQILICELPHKLERASGNRT